MQGNSNVMSSQSSYIKSLEAGVTRQSQTGCKSAEYTGRALRYAVIEVLKSNRCSITQRCSALGRIELKSLVSTSRYWVCSPMSGIYATMESARVSYHAPRTNGPLSGTSYAVAMTHTNGPPT